MNAFHEENVINQNFPFRLNHHSGKFLFPPHWHEEIEIFYVCSGECDVWVNDICYTLVAGEMIFIGNKDIHRYSGEKNSEHILLLFDLSLIKNIYSNLTYLKSGKPVFHPSPSSSQSDRRVHGELIHILDDIEREYLGKREAYKLEIIAGLYKIIALLLRYTPMSYYSKIEKAKHHQKISIIEGIYHYIHEHFHERITLEDMARISHFSTFHFTRFFKKATGITFLHYLHLYRLDKAKDLLVLKDDNIIDVALQCGFENVKTFNRVFKKYMGMTPSSFRRQEISSIETPKHSNF